MAADLLQEGLVQLNVAGGEFPGRKVDYHTIRRWRTVGVRGAILETVTIGGARYTSKQAIARFVTAQNKGAGC